MGNNESFGVHTDVTKLINLERRIRPYRMAIIKIIKTVDIALTYEYIFNEFEDTLITSTVDGTGIYTFNLDTTNFKDVTRVIQKSDLTHTEIFSPILSSTFENSTRERLVVLVYDVNAFDYVDVAGEIMIYIKEFYGPR